MLWADIALPAEHTIVGFRLGLCIFEDTEVVDFSASCGVLSVARRSDPRIGAFFIAESRQLVQASTGFTALPNYRFNEQPALDAFLIPGGAGTRQETFNRRLHQYVRDLLDSTSQAGWYNGRELCPDWPALPA